MTKDRLTALDYANGYDNFYRLHPEFRMTIAVGGRWLGIKRWRLSGSKGKESSGQPQSKLYYRRLSASDGWAVMGSSSSFHQGAYPGVGMKSMAPCNLMEMSDLKVPLSRYHRRRWAQVVPAAVASQAGMPGCWRELHLSRSWGPEKGLPHYSGKRRPCHGSC